MSIVMSWEEWSRYDAVGLADLVRRKQVTPPELAEQVAAGIAQVNPTIHAVIEIFDDVVEDPFKDGTAPDGPFAGVPYLMKDLGPTVKGRKQEMGALLMQGNIASADSFLTSKIRQAGLNIMGRTTTSEFGVCGSAENPKIYILRNPWNLAYTTGGSSSGTGAIVASGVIPLSHASDGGGSIRGPAEDQWQHWAEAVLGRVLRRTRRVRPDGGCRRAGLPQPHGARYGRVHRRMPRRGGRTCST